MGIWGGKIGEGVVRYRPQTNSFLLFGVLTSVPILVKIDQEMRPWECSQTDRQTDRQTHTHTDANRFYNLSHAICYSYGTDNNWNPSSMFSSFCYLLQLSDTAYKLQSAKCRPQVELKCLKDGQSFRTLYIILCISISYFKRRSTYSFNFLNCTRKIS